MIIHRTLSTHILEMSTKFPVIFLTGPRQSGKTTLVKEIFPQHTYVNLERPDIRSLIQADPLGFLNNNHKGIIFDEAQYIPELFSYIQTKVDETNLPGQFILSGSQSFLMNKHISQSLAGRAHINHLLPFDYNEIKHLYPFTLNKLLFNGFYPRIFQSDIQPIDFYPSYIQTYIERDIRTLRSIENLNDFTRFLSLCAGRIGQLLNLTSLANDTGISVNTAKSWISLLEASYIIFLLQPYYQNFNKRIIKAPKLYFYDTGIVCSLLRINNSEMLNTHYLYGSLFENFIIAELLKQSLHQGYKLNMYYWRESNGNEIDLMIENNEAIDAIEIKAGSTIQNDYFKSFKVLPENSSTLFKKKVVYNGDIKTSVNNIAIIPWQDFLSKG